MFCSRMRVCLPQMIPGLCLVILSSLTVSSKLGMEEVFFGPQDQTVKVGEEASFRCVSGESSPPATILWLKDGSVVTTGRQSQGEYGGGREKKTSGTLHLVNVSVEDGGVYICQTINPLFNISRNSRPAKLIVLVAPSVTLRPPALTVALGGRASLQCEASGEPPPTLSWLKRGHSKLTGAKMTRGARNATLRIESAHSYDEGTYVCEASNALGRSQATVTLIVAVSPVMVNSVDRVACRHGGSAVLPCMAVGVLPIWYVWTRDHEAKTPIGTSDRIHIDEDGSLHFSSVKASDAGDYFCTAENRAGRQRIHTILMVMGSSSSSPSLSPQLQSTDIPPGQPLVTQVQPPMLPPPPYPKFQMELPQHPEPQTDARPTTQAFTHPPRTRATKSSPIHLENSLQKPPPLQNRPPTTKPAEVRGLNGSGGQNGSQQDQPVESSKVEYEEQRNTSQSPMTSNDPRSIVTPQSPSWLPVLEKHDVPIVVGVGVSLAFIFITVAFYSVVQKNEPAPTGRAAQRKLGVPMRHAERHPTGRPYENQAFEDDECLAVTEHNANTSDTRARPSSLSLVTVQMEPTCQEPCSVTVETYPEPVVDTKIDHAEDEETEDEEKSCATPSTLNSPSLQLTEEEWPSMAADNRSLCQDTLPPPSSLPSPSNSPPNTGLRSSLTLRGAEALAAPVHHSLSVSHGGAPLVISHHVSVGHATVAVDVHFYPVASTPGTSVATSTWESKQENDKARLHQSK